LLASIDLLGDDGGSTFPQLPSDKQEGSNRGSGDDEIDCSEEGRGGGATKKELRKANTSRLTNQDAGFIFKKKG